jgi:O-antigen/teichoic acid export membrane protein
MTTDARVATLTGRRLVWHSLLNSAGQGIPFATAVIAIPILARSIGRERFGLLTIIWSVIGYFSLFDFGLSRALTQLVAQDRNSADQSRLVDSTRTALVLMAIAGAAGGVAAGMASGWLTQRVLVITPELRADALSAFRLLSTGVPIVVLTAGCRGLLEAYERFDLVNAVRLPLGVFTFVGPLFVIPFTPSLTAIVALLVAGRVIALGASLGFCRRVMPDLFHRRTFVSKSIVPLVRFGTWMTVSNIVNPVLVLADRFLLGAMISASIVAYYTAPYEMVTKLGVFIAVAIATSLFPAYAASVSAGNAPALFARGLLITCVALFPVMVAVVALAPELLSLWLGPVYATESARVLRILGVGVFLNGLAQIPFAFVQGVGRADLTAKLHLAELPLYLVLVTLLIRARGVDGAALAWTIRVGADAALLFWVAHRVHPALREVTRRLFVLVATSVATVVMACSIGSMPPAARAGFAALGTVLLVAGAWMYVVTAAERQRIRNWVGAGNREQAAVSSPGHRGGVRRTASARLLMSTVRNPPGLARPFWNR